MKAILRLEKNTLGRDFAVGDLHGCFFMLEEALKAASFNPETDRVICVGDLVDKGPESHRALEFLNKNWFYTVRGDHEDIIPQDIETMNREGKDVVSDEYKRNGMGWILELNEAEQKEFSRVFHDLPYAIEVPFLDDALAGFVHAEVTEDLTWQEFTAKLENGDQATIQIALKSRSRIKKAHVGGYKNVEGVKGIDRLFTGHSLAASRGPRAMGNWYLIDTGAVSRYLNERDGMFPDLDPENFHLTLADIRAEANDLSRARPNDDNRYYQIIYRSIV